MTDKFVDAVQNLANFKFYLLSRKKQNRLERQLHLWRNARDKHNVDDYYSDPDFGLIYAKNLYKARFKCFYNLLCHVCDNIQIKGILKESTQVMSICCGPGPDIAAYICFVRNFLQLPYQELTITGVDKLAYWEEYVKSISHLDSYSTISFTSSMVTSDFLLKLQNNKYDLCIMSYPQAVCFDRDVWRWLQRKFLFILVLDQGKYELHSTIKKYGFRLDEFECVGIKRYFYWINPCCQFTCNRHHEVNGQFSMCYQDVYHEFDCRHTIIIKCHSYDQDIRTIKCEVMVAFRKQCDHIVHIKCSLKDQEEYKHCMEWINVRHTHCQKLFRMRCYEKRFQIAECYELVNYTFKCGHKTSFYCNSYDHDVKTKICEEPFIKDCGHKTKIRCGLIKANAMSELERDCEERCGGILPLCGHVCSYNCKSCYCDNLHAACAEKCTARLECGHKCSLTCHLGVHAYHKCAVNCMRFSLVKLLKSKSERHKFDWSSKKRWWDLLQEHQKYPVDDAELKSHLERLVALMTQMRQFAVIHDIKDMIYEVLNKLISMYCYFQSEHGSHYLMKLCKKLIILIDVEHPFKLNYDIRIIEVQRKHLLSIYAKFGASMNHLNMATHRLSEIECTPKIRQVNNFVVVGE